MNYIFTINEFEGPLDLLLSLVKKAKMDIYEISIKDLIDEYIGFLKEQEELNIDIASEYLVMASDLLHLKSRMLINKEAEEEEESETGILTEDDLREKLVEYQKIKDITCSLKDLELKRKEIHEKSPENYKDYSDKPIYEEQIGNVNDLYQAILAFQKHLKLEKPLNTSITKKEINIEERINDIRKILSKKKKIDFLELFDKPTKEYIVVTFLSILDMSKNDEINIIQEGNFKPIMIEKR